MVYLPYNRRQFLGTIARGATGAALASYSCSLPVTPAPSAGNTGYVYDPRFAGYFQNLAELPERVTSINSHLRTIGLSSLLTQVTPIGDPMQYISRVHSADHIRRVQALGIEQEHGATERIGTVAELAVAGILGAVRDVCEGRIRNAFCNIRPPGHHQIDFGGPYGYCIYANVVIAARFALERYPDLIGKVLIVDWDYHHGNGTEYFVKTDPRLCFYDTCCGAFWDGGDESVHGAMDSQSGNEGFLLEWERELVPLARSFKPDLIIVSAGFDSKRGDIFSGLGLTARGYSLLTRRLMNLADEFASGRIVSVLEGGYADINSDPETFFGLTQCVENHVKTLVSGHVQPETLYFTNMPPDPEA
jgi:acetoin utilization deacetylase AcuC-like enzyme